MTEGASGPCIVAVEPTVFFTREGADLRQAVDVRVRHRGADRLRLSLTLDDRTLERDLEPSVAGEAMHRISVPDARQATTAMVRLHAAGELVHERAIPWRPQRHWTVYLVHLSHFDPGHTDLPSHVMRHYLDHLDRVVEWCEQTTSWPEEARFRYVVEQAWVAWHYLSHRPASLAERFARFCRAGQIEVSAFWANMVSDLLGAEEVARLLYPAFEIARRHDIPVNTAQHNDIPGMAWSLATVLADAGVRWLVAGVPDYFSPTYVGAERADAGGRSCHRNFDDGRVQPRDCPVAYRWEAQDGRQVLVYLHRQGAGGDVDTNLSRLPGVLGHLEAEGYPYDLLRYCVRGARTDNAPPRLDFAQAVKDWNARWAFPRLVMATDAMFCAALEAVLPQDLPVHRGHWPDTDYPLGATSTAEELGVNRAAKEMLLAGERLATVASALGPGVSARDRIAEAYQDVLAFDEHAWGLTRPFGWADGAHGREKALYAHHAAAAAHDVLQKSVNAIADHVSLEHEGWHILVFNALDHPRSDLVEVPFLPPRPSGMPLHLLHPPAGDPSAPFWVSGFAEGRPLHLLPLELTDGRFAVVDVASGEPVAHQLLPLPAQPVPDRFSSQRQAYAGHAPEAAWRLQFIAREVPSLGCRAYRIVRRPEAPAYRTALRVHGRTLENEPYRLTVDASTGAVSSIVDQELGIELVDARVRHGVNGLFARDVTSGRLDRPGGVSVEPLRRGPVSASLLVRASLAGAPQVLGEVVLYDGLKRIDFFDRLLKDADGSRAFFVAFPFRVVRPRFRFDVGMNVVRPIEDQFPGTTTDYHAVQRWVGVERGDGEWGIAWSAREAPLVQLGGNWPDYVSPAHHGVRPYGFLHAFLADPAQLEHGHLYSYLANNNFLTNFALSQPGVLHTSYSLASGKDAGGIRAARRFGAGFCSPLEHAVVPGPQAGRLAPVHSFAAVDCPNVTVVTIKQAEDGRGTIVRLLETEGIETRATVDLPLLAFSRAARTCVVETGESPLAVHGSQFTVHVKPWSVATVRLQ